MKAREAHYYVSRLGNASSAASVDYSTNDATASNRTITFTASGTLHFAAGEAVKTFQYRFVDDLYVEGNETINLI